MRPELHTCAGLVPVFAFMDSENYGWSAGGFLVFFFLRWHFLKQGDQEPLLPSSPEDFVHWRSPGTLTCFPVTNVFIVTFKPLNGVTVVEKA